MERPNPQLQRAPLPAALSRNPDDEIVQGRRGPTESRS